MLKVECRNAKRRYQYDAFLLTNHSFYKMLQLFLNSAILNLILFESFGKLETVSFFLIF